MRVLFITLFSEISGSSRIMAYQFLPFLEKEGIEYRAESVYSDKFFKTQMGLEKAGKIKKQLNFIYYLFLGVLKRIYFSIESKNYNAVFVQRDSFPKSIYWLLIYMNPNVIYEFEDTFRETNPFLKRSFFHRILLNYQRSLYRNMVQKATLVVAANEYVAEEARAVNDRVAIICEPINTDLCRPAEFRRESDKVTLGWIGSPSTTVFLRSIAGVFPEIAKRHPNAQLKLVGAAPDFQVSGISLIKKEWSPQDELSDLRSFDIGLMPLADDPFYRGHLGHKMIQYMCVGIPVVASNTGLNPTVVKDNVNGFLANNEKEWIEKLSLLIEDYELRKKLGAAGREIAENRFSLKKNADILINCLKAVSKN